MRFDTDNIINNIIKDTFKNDNSKEQFFNIKQNKNNNICNNKHSPLLYEYDFSKLSLKQLKHNLIRFPVMEGVSKIEYKNYIFIYISNKNKKLQNKYNKYLKKFKIIPYAKLLDTTNISGIDTLVLHGFDVLKQKGKIISDKYDIYKLSPFITIYKTNEENKNEEEDTYLDIDLMPKYVKRNRIFNINERFNKSLDTNNMVIQVKKR